MALGLILLDGNRMKSGTHVREKQQHFPSHINNMIPEERTTEFLSKKSAGRHIGGRP